MDIKDVKKAPYNPRKMGRSARRGLDNSIEAFDDISGITINKRTGNIVSGNHRFTSLCDKHKKTNLEMVHVKGDRFEIVLKSGGTTGFYVRVVDWDISKEKTANVVANSGLVSGEFTHDVQVVLKEIAIDLDAPLFDGLRLDEMMIDIDLDNGLSLDDDCPLPSDFAKADLEESTTEVPDSEPKELSKSVPRLLELIKVSVPDDLIDEVKRDLLEFLAKQDYYNEITVV